MEMNLEVYTNPGATAQKTSHSDEGTHENEFNLETCSKRNNRDSVNSGPNTAWSRWYRLTIVCVTLLCVLLLSAVIVLWIKFNNLNTENNQLQTSYNNLTTERDRLQTSYNNLTIERNQCQTRNNNLTLERDQLLMERDEIFKHVQGWTVFGSSFYYISTEMKNWTASRQDCTERESHLVIINTTEEQEFMLKLVGSGRRAWIGLSDINTEEEWKWVDGTPLTTAYWDVGEPNNLNDEDCAEIRVNSDDINKWNDLPCSLNVLWICERSYFNN